jgi:hypothetical protein
MIGKDRSQDQPFTVKGHWWLPNLTQKVAGDLIYDVEKMTLALYGGLNNAVVDTPFNVTPEETQFPLIHGESLSGVPITLLKSFYTAWTPDIRTLAISPGTRKALLSSKLTCHIMIEGAHLSSPNDTFLKCCIEVPHLETWLGDSPFTVEMVKSGEQVNLHYARPGNQEFSLPTCNCSVRFVRSVVPPGAPGHTASVEHRTVVEIEALKPMSLSSFTERASEIVDLFSFLYGANVLSRRLMLFRSSKDNDGVALYYPRHPVEARRSQDSDILIRYESLKAVFWQVLANWLSAAKVTKRARRIVLSSERRPSAFIEFRFLPLLHAVEVLAKEMGDSGIVDATMFKEIKRRMLSTLPDGLPTELVESIRNSLGWANGHNLRAKLLTMLDGLQDETCHLFCVDKMKFAKGIVDTRNYYTHYSERTRLLQGAELHWAIQKTSLMLRILLLLRAGVPESDLQRAVHGHLRLRNEKAVWREVTEEGSPVGIADGGSC